MVETRQGNESLETLWFCSLARLLVCSLLPDARGGVVNHLHPPSSPWENGSPLMEKLSTLLLNPLKLLLHKTSLHSYEKAS